MSSRIKALRDRKAAIVRDMESILSAADSASRDLTEEETATYAEHETELKVLAAKLEREERLQEAERQLTGRQPEEVPTRIYRQAEAFTADPKKGFKDHREFLLGVINCSQTGEVRDERLRYLSDRRINYWATAGGDEHGTYAAPYGGFLVPEGFSPSFLATTPEADPIGGRTTKVPMTAPKVSFNARVDKNHTTSVSGGLTVKRRVETQSQASSRMAFEQVTLNADSLYGLAYATEELLSDSPLSFIGILDAGFRDQFVSHLIGERLEGTGVGEYMGIWNSPCVIDVAKEVGQAPDTILYENLINMRSRCWRYGDAVWLYNHDCLPQLMSLFMAIGTGGVPMWQTSAREGEPDMLLGRPAFPSEYCENVGDAGDLNLCVWGEYLEGIYQPMQSAESIHVRFEQLERTFRFTMRCGGAPWWKSALTPKKSAATLSPFVRLAARA